LNIILKNATDLNGKKVDVVIESGKITNSISGGIVGQTNWTPATGEIIVTSNLLDLEVDGRYPGQNPALRGAVYLSTK
jgi:dihydroorotase-like cyclic amidohydrolase